MTKDFFDLIMKTPEAERHGRVFKLNGLKTRTPITPKRVCRLVSKIGKRAGVIVARTEKQVKDEKTGKLETVEVKKFASAHDLRRSFLTRWSRLVPSAVLMKLARHREITTTLKYYVSVDCDELGDLIWDRGEQTANKSANKQPNEAKNEGENSDAETQENPI